MSTEGDYPSVSHKSKAEISPFIVNILASMATMLNGKADLNSSSVSTDQGYMSISLCCADTVNVNSLQIGEEYQGQGYGSKFLTALELAVSRSAMSTMKLELYPAKTAIGFYLKQGWSLIVSFSPLAEYDIQRSKLWGDSWTKYRAVVLSKLLGNNEWTNDMLEPLFKDSGIVGDNPKFYSLWIGDITEGHYRSMIKVIQPSRGNRLSSGV